MAEEDQNQNDDQAQKLIDALAPKLAEAILPQITEQVESQIKGISDKNQELLDKLAKQKASDDKLAQTTQFLDALAADDKRKKMENAGVFDARKAGEPLRIKRSDARDVQAYRQAKKLAADQGVALEIIADDA